MEGLTFAPCRPNRLTSTCIRSLSLKVTERHAFAARPSRMHGMRKATAKIPGGGHNRTPLFPLLRSYHRHPEAHPCFVYDGRCLCCYYYHHDHYDYDYSGVSACPFVCPTIHYVSTNPSVVPGQLCSCCTITITTLIHCEFKITNKQRKQRTKTSERGSDWQPRGSGWP